MITNTYRKLFRLALIALAVAAPRYSWHNFLHGIREHMKFSGSTNYIMQKINEWSNI